MNTADDSELRDAIETAADALAQALELLPAPQQPPAIASMEGAAKAAMLSVRMTESTLEALAAYALDQGTTQRRVIAEALAKHGVRVAARDLEDRPLPRRRGGQRAA
jgi:hypothetical protein